MKNKTEHFNHDNRTCPACGGNDFDTPCAYPGSHERKSGCLRYKSFNIQEKKKMTNKFNIGDRVMTWDGLTAKIFNVIETDNGFIYSIKYDYPDMVRRKNPFASDNEYSQYFADCLTLL